MLQTINPESNRDTGGGDDKALHYMLLVRVPMSAEQIFGQTLTWSSAVGLGRAGFIAASFMRVRLRLAR